MQSLRAFLDEKLAAVAEEIFGAVEKTIAEYREEISRSKDLEISRLRLQLKLLKSDARTDRRLGVQLQQPTHHHAPSQQHHQSVPPVEAAEPQHSEEVGGQCMEQEPPEPSQIKKEQQKSHRGFWVDHNTEQLEGLESDIKDFISSTSSLKSSLQYPSLPFHPYHNNTNNMQQQIPSLYRVAGVHWSDSTPMSRTHPMCLLLATLTKRGRETPKKRKKGSQKEQREGGGGGE
ncbi:hypothetical protein Q8A73_007799 [Channa argus]|nr:hypothetical protein Q8A73_007799 [Channa argus]